MSATAETAASLTDAERREKLNVAVADRVNRGWRVESQTEYQATMAKGHHHSHLLHLILTILTLGLWGLFVWLPLAVFGGEKRVVLRVTEDGRISAS